MPLWPWDRNEAMLGRPGTRTSPLPSSVAVWLPASACPFPTRCEPQSFPKQKEDHAFVSSKTMARHVGHQVQTLRPVLFRIALLPLQDALPLRRPQRNPAQPPPAGSCATQGPTGSSRNPTPFFYPPLCVALCLRC